MSINQFMYYFSKIQSLEHNLNRDVKRYGADFVLDQIVGIFIQLGHFQDAQGILSKIGLSNVRAGYPTASAKDKKIIKKYQPIFYNYTNHRQVNKSDVGSILNQADRYIHQFL